MGIFSRSVRAVADTLEERFNGASALHGSALAVFDELAERLSDAAMEYQAIDDAAIAEIDALNMLRDRTHINMRRATDSAVAVLDITRGFRND